MKKLALALSVIILSVAAHAQEKMKMKSSNSSKSSKLPHLSFAIDAGAPLGKINSQTYNFVIGGDLQIDYNLIERLNVLASIGFDARLYKGGIVKTDYYMPLLGGLRYFFTNKIYITEQAGISVAATNTLRNAFTDVAGLGYKLSAKTDAMLGYKGLFYSGTGTSTFSCLQLRIAYNFGK